MTDRPTASTITDAQLDALYDEIARLRAGEEPGWDEACYPTPGQWIRRFNQATPQERHDAAKRAIDNSQRANDCVLSNHTERLAQVEELLRIAHETSNKSETERALAVQRAEAAEGALNRVRLAVFIADDEDVTDWQRGFRSCAGRVLFELDTPKEPTP